MPARLLIPILSRAAACAVASITLPATARAAPPSNICPNARFAWSENAGWLNLKSSGAQGVVVFPTHCRGYAWGENLGWINLGPGGGPYTNTTGADFGVNINPTSGLLSGFAWSENAGWINLDTSAALGPSLAARIDVPARRFRGYAWAENLGWINLDSLESAKFVAAMPADTNGDGFVDFFDLNNLLSEFGQTGPALVGDVNDDGAVDFLDLNLVLSFFGAACA